MILTVLRNSDQVFCSMSLYWDLPVFFMIKLRLWVLGRMTIDVKCYFHHITPRYILSTWFITVDIDSNHPLRVFVRFLSINMFLFCFYFIYLFIHLLAVLDLRCCMQAFPSSCERGGYSSLRCAGFSLPWLLLLQSMGSRCTGFSSCSTWAQ